MRVRARPRPEALGLLSAWAALSLMWLIMRLSLSGASPRLAILRSALISSARAAPCPTSHEPETQLQNLTPCIPLPKADPMRCIIDSLFQWYWDLDPKLQGCHVPQCMMTS